jgi:hypothetical protein
MDKAATHDAKTIAAGQTITGAFATEAAARGAVQRLERAGMPPDRIGVISGNVRQAREVAGSYSPQGAIVGAIVGVVVVVAFLVFGGEPVRQNAVSAGLGAIAIIVGLAFIGWLAGRARLFKQDEAAEREDEVASGDVLVTVVCDTLDGADQTRAILERAGATDLRVENSAESV